jgi:hypothetical protein
MELPASLLLKGLVAVLAVGIVGAAGFFAFNKQTPPAEKIHIHAGFQVYRDGVKQDFSDMKYMKIEPCTTKEHKLTAEEEQQERAHLHDQNGDIVHVHRKGATWGDLFKNIDYQLPKDKEVASYDGDQKIDNFLSTQVQAYQSVVIVIGDQSKAAEFAKGRVTVERIKEVEKLSEKCGEDEQ